MSDNNSVTVVFLDIDGVLLPFGDHYMNLKLPISAVDHNEEDNKSSCDAIFPDRTLAALSKIMEEVDRSVIVLSSTWRVRFKKDIIDSFQKYGKKFGGPLLEITDFYDITDINYHSERQWEIHRWLERFNEQNTGTTIKSWIALDDEELVIGHSNTKYRKEFEGHVVKTVSSIGLTEEDAKLAVHLCESQSRKQSVSIHGASNRATGSCYMAENNA